MQASVSQKRWEVAQQAESAYWQGVTFAELLRILAEKPRFFRTLGADRTAELFDGKDVVEIGCGPFGLSIGSFRPSHIKLNSLLKTDPLPHRDLGWLSIDASVGEKELMKWLEALSNDGEYRQLSGEKIDYSEEFDTAVCYNVLDHVQDPRAVMVNIWNALRRGGRCIVGVDCRSILGRIKLEHYTRKRRKGETVVDAHPHSFITSQVTGLMESAGFENVEVLGLPGWKTRLLGSTFRPLFLGRKPLAPA